MPLSFLVVVSIYNVEKEVISERRLIIMGVMGNISTKEGEPRNEG